MDFRNTSSNKKRRSRAALTLVETMIAMFISSLVFMVLAGVIVYTSRSFAALGYHSLPLSFTYTPGDKRLTLTDTNGAQRALLEGCDYLDFQIFQRTSIAGVYDQYPVTADEAAAKIVQISWVCSRSLIANLINSESVQSAKIVIRKQ